MKLAFTIFRYFPYGGLQLDFSRFLREGLHRGHEITVLYDRWEGDFIPGAEYRQLSCHAAANYARAVEFERQTSEYAKSHSFERIIGFNRMSGLDFYFAGDNCFTAAARRKHPIARRLLPRYRVFERLEAAVGGKDSKTIILYLTEAQKREYQYYYGTAENRFRYLPPEVAPEFRLYSAEETAVIRQKVRREFGLSENTMLLVQVCSAYHTKGVDRVIKALSALSEDLREKLIYLVAGTESPGFRKQAALAGLSGNTIFAGPRQDVPDLLTASDLMVHPAREEAAGAVLAEAAVCGLPVICSANCGYAPLTEAAGGIVLPQPFTEQSLTEAIDLTLRLPGNLQRMRSAARKYAEQADFYHRTETFWKFIEEAHHA